MRSPITTHVLDLAKGKAAKGIPVALEMRLKGKWKPISQGVTNQDGRVENLLPLGSQAKRGEYRLVFLVKKYFGSKGFYSEIVVAFHLRDSKRHHHVPLLLSPYGYSTYRGT